MHCTPQSTPEKTSEAEAHCSRAAQHLLVNHTGPPTVCTHSAVKWGMTIRSTKKLRDKKGPAQKTPPKEGVGGISSGHMGMLKCHINTSSSYSSP